MRSGVRRVPTDGLSHATYTLGAGEAFRLDALSFTDTFAEEGTFVIPTLTAQTQDGHVIAEIQAPEILISAPLPSGFSYTGPAVFGDSYSVLPPDGYTGYALHDFGAGVTTAHMFAAWTQPPGLAAASFSSWLRSAGAVTMGAAIGSSTVEAASSVTVALTSAIAAGHYLLLHLTMIQPFALALGTVPRPTATGSVAGNVLDFDNAVTYGYGLQSVALGGSRFLNSCALFYRIVNPIGIGGTVTVNLPGGAARWLDLTVHDVTGLTVGNPIGPNPGGNFVGAGVGGATSPLDYNGTGTVPKWVGGVLVNSSYRIASGGTLDVMMARGGVEIQPLFASPAVGATTYIQAPLPELHLEEGDTLTVSSQDTGIERISDTLSAFNIWAIDE